MMQLKKILTTNIYCNNYCRIEPCKQDVTNLFDYFTEAENLLQFGTKDKNDNEVLKEFKHKPWQFYSLIYSEHSQKLRGYLRFIIVDDTKKIISLHGGGIGKGIAETRVYVEAWKLILHKLKHELQCSRIESYCNNENTKAKIFLEKTGVEIKIK
jgi:RimJ/RimL family protein N-acetyltransferase